LELEHNALVVDASVGIKLFVDEQGSEMAERIFILLASNPPITLYVPDLFYIECANILWKYTRHHDYPAEFARENIADLLMLALQSIPTSALIKDALELALAYQISAYDACYIALAQKLNLPFLTADSALINKTRSAQVTIIDLFSLEQNPDHVNGS